MSTNSSYKFLLPLVLIPLILVIIWFRDGLMIVSGEEGLRFYNPSKTLELSGGWIEFATGIVNLGELPRITLFYPLSILYEKLHVPNFILQAMTFYILLVVGMISYYFLILSFLSKEKNNFLIALISAIFYLLNPYSISQIWGRSITIQYFAFALLPLSILIFLQGLKKRQYIFAFFLIFASLIFSTAFSFVTFIMVYWLVLLLTLIFWVKGSNQKKGDLLFGCSYLVLCFFLWIIAHSWWVQGYIPSNNFTTDRLGSFEGNLNSLLGVSRNFTPDLVVRLLQRSYFSDVGYYGKIYISIPFQLISLLLPFFAIWGAVKVIKKEKLKQLRFFIILFTLGLFVSLGANPPFGWLFIWIFKKFIFLQPFRNPYEKFGLVYTLGYVPLFAVGIVYFFRDRFFHSRINSGGLITTLILICGIFVWPIWTGRIFAGPDKKVGIQIPTYYQDLDEFLNTNSKDYRVFMTPLWAEGISTYLWNDRIYLGFDPTLFIIKQPTISNTLHDPYYYEFTSNIKRYLERINLGPSLSLLRAKYLVDREDATIVPDHERLQHKFLTTTIQPPNELSKVKRSVCQNMNVLSQDIRVVKLICPIPENEQDWQGIRYLHLEVKTNTEVYLEVAITDKNGVRNRWDGKIVSEYQTNNQDWKSLTIPINIPTEYSFSNPIALSNINTLEVLAYPKDSQSSNELSIQLKDIKLDSGNEVLTNEFKLIKTFGKLKLYEPNSFKSPPEFGILSQINGVEDYTQLFQSANQKRDSIDREGFLLTSQNPNKDQSFLSKSVNSKIINKSKISETRYWVETEQISGDNFLVLSKTFNPSWKLIPNMSKDDMDGSFTNDLKILKKAYLPEDNHFVVNGYANLWKVGNQPVGQNGKYAIVFLPKIVENIGLKVSIFSVLLMIGVTGVWGVIKLFRFYPKK